jgi:hypothetical protein
MTPERWQKIRDVLAQALLLAPEERPALLDRACSFEVKWFNPDAFAYAEIRDIAIVLRHHIFDSQE